MNIAAQVHEVMARDLVTVSPQDEITRVVNLLIEHDISGVPVVDADGMLVGILTERDCIEIALDAGYFDDRGGNVSEYMSAPVETVEADMGLVEVAKRLCRSSYRRFPVLDEGRLVGLISRRDVLKVLNAGAWFAVTSTTDARS